MSIVFAHLSSLNSVLIVELFLSLPISFKSSMRSQLLGDAFYTLFGSFIVFLWMMMMMIIIIIIIIIII